MAEKEEDANQKMIDMYLGYIKNTRKTWEDVDPIKNQQRAYLGITNDIGNICIEYTNMLGKDTQLGVDVATVLVDIEGVTYHIARLLDELFYRNEEQFTNTDSKTIFDQIVEEAALIFNGKNKLDEEVDALKLVLSLPCYYKDIYIGVINKDPKTFGIGLLSLTAGLLELTTLLGEDYIEIFTKQQESKNNSNGAK